MVHMLDNGNAYACILSDTFSLQRDIDIFFIPFGAVGPLNWETETISFFDVISCGLISHSSCYSILRTYAFSIISASIYFPEKFIELSKDHILSPMLRVYAMSCHSSQGLEQEEHIYQHAFFGVLQCSIVLHISNQL